MARNTELKRSSARTMLPSVLDRLIDLEPTNRNEATIARAQTLKELKDSVRRDLEWLLNSVRTPHEAPPAFRELWKSVYSYGLPDTTGLALKSSDERNRLARVVEVAIADFEPRLMNVAVTVPATSTISRVVHFHIEALLRMEPAPERIFFDTTLELMTGQYDVGGETRAR